MKQEVARKSWFDGEQFVSGWAGGQLEYMIIYNNKLNFEQVLLYQNK